MKEEQFKIERFKELVAETIKMGYGSVLLEVLVQSGNIKMVSLTKKETHSIQND